MQSIVASLGDIDHRGSAIHIFHHIGSALGFVCFLSQIKIESIVGHRNRIGGAFYQNIGHRSRRNSRCRIVIEGVVDQAGLHIRTVVKANGRSAIIRIDGIIVKSGVFYDKVPVLPLETDNGTAHRRGILAGLIVLEHTIGNDHIHGVGSGSDSGSALGSLGQSVAVKDTAIDYQLGSGTGISCKVEHTAHARIVLHPGESDAFQHQPGCLGAQYTLRRIGIDRGVLADDGQVDPVCIGIHVVLREDMPRFQINGHRLISRHIVYSCPNLGIYSIYGHTLGIIPVGLHIIHFIRMDGQTAYGSHEGRTYKRNRFFHDFKF